MSDITIKQGAEFSISCVITENGTPKSLAGITLKSQVRCAANDALICDLDILVTDEALGMYTMTAPLGTSTWTIGQLNFDVRLTENEKHTFTNNGTITVEKGITK